MTIQVEVEAGVAVATIGHPPSNLIDATFFLALMEMITSVEANEDVRVLVLRSADPDFFVMHGDVHLVGSYAPPYEPSDEPNIAAATFSGLRSGRLVTIGLLDGFARGGGCELLCSLDLRFGSERSVVGQPEVALGIIAGAGGTARWPEIVGRGRALDILLTGRDVAADELYAIGWLDRLVPSPQIDAIGLRAARLIAAMPPEAVAATKRVVDMPADRALVAESDEVAKLLATGRHKERMQRFVEVGGQDREREIAGMEPILNDVLGI